ncbi:MAG: ribosome maturation factor RimP [Syntrophobacterales bacterium]|nr:ribosome maturation factor RimP [Syntrophobacterales bacterium]
MADKRDFLNELWSMIEPVVNSEGVELLELEFRRERQGYVLRIFIDHEEGITIEDCSRVSATVSDFLDVTDPIHHTYHLEVSSPGLDRPLRKPEHFTRHLGSIIVVKTSSPILNRKNFKGLLKEASEEEIVIECDGMNFTIPLKDIDRANLSYFDTEKAKSKNKGRKRHSFS